MNRRLLIVAVMVFALTACDPQGKAALAPNSIAAARATNEAAASPSGNTPTAVTTTPPVAMAVADALPAAEPDETMNQAEPGLDRLLVALAVVVGIPLFWMLRLKFFNAIRRTRRTA